MVFLRSAAIALAIAAGIALAGDETHSEEKWDHDTGKPAPRLVGGGWIGTPVSLEAVKGNTIVLAFWNTDVPWC